jgi:hypothetical protein
VLARVHRPGRTLLLTSSPREGNDVEPFTFLRLVAEAFRTQPFFHPLTCCAREKPLFPAPFSYNNADRRVVMLKHLFAAVAFTACLAAPADAQNGAPPLVETMTCDQMTAEMMVAGQRMNAQMDPEFAAEAQAMQQEAQNAQRPTMVAGIGAGLACSIPGVGMACMAAQQAQMADAQAQAQANRQRMDAQIGRVNDSMEGLDQNRLMAISDRYEAMNCQAPQ